MRVVTLKPILCVIMIFTLFFSFPIQIVFSTPLPSLIPYIVIFILFCLSFVYTKNNSINYYRKKRINQLILIYFSLVLFHTTWQVLLNFISLPNAISAIAIYVLPILFYIYFYKYATDKELYTVLISISIVGLISGLYFVYDSYYVFVNSQISDYSKKVMAYTISRSPDQESHNFSRVSLWSRGHGLLEKHAISSAWTAISCFSTLAIFPKKYQKIRLSIILIFFSILSISLNFTAIGTFLFVIIFFELKFYLLFKGLVNKNIFKILGIIIILIFPMILLFSSYSLGLYNKILLSITGQIDLALGIKKFSDDTTFFGNFILGYINYPYKMLSFPPGLLIGDGFSNWGVIPKGGDYGHVEILHRLGFPLYFAVLLGLARMIKLSLKKIHLDRWEINKNQKFLEFAVPTTLYILITTIHYSTLQSKSIIAIFFICVAIFSKYLPSKIPYQKNKIF